MGIERIDSVNMSYPNEAAIPKAAEAHHGNLKDENSDGEKTRPLGETKMQNRVREQVLKGLDLNGDGVVSQTEAIANASKYNQADYLSQDGAEIRNRILEQVLNGLDLNADGVVSQAEAIKNASKYSQAVPASQSGGKTKDRDLEEVLNGSGPEGTSLSVLA